MRDFIGDNIHAFCFIRNNFIRNLHVEGWRIQGTFQGSFQCENFIITLSNQELESRFHTFIAKTHIDCVLCLCQVLHRVLSGYAVSLPLPIKR